eukprot:c3527_g1_i1.p1 GENE.c3527_g1_i1~~c3527_g1_i1.p1  ORF type:complete len:251 (-),score=22.93 c3527_g1_i1:165-917(-)
MGYIHEYFDISPTRGARQLCLNCKCAISLVLPHADLPASSRALRGWDRSMQALQRPPVSWGFVLFLFDWFFRRKCPQFAIAVVVSTDLYLRVSELRNIRRGDVTFPSGGVRLAEIKTCFNHSVVLRDTFVTSCLEWLLRHSSQELVFDFACSTFLDALTSAQQQIGLSQNFKFTTHSFRHAGATRDLKRGLPFADIVLRGRWTDETSARRYIQTSQAHTFASSLPDNIRQLCDRLEKHPNTLQRHLNQPV